jgi:hypothetical protein
MIKPPVTFSVRHRATKAETVIKVFFPLVSGVGAAPAERSREVPGTRLSSGITGVLGRFSSHNSLE